MKPSLSKLSSRLTALAFTLALAGFSFANGACSSTDDKGGGGSGGGDGPCAAYSNCTDCIDKTINADQRCLWCAGSCVPKTSDLVNTCEYGLAEHDNVCDSVVLDRTSLEVDCRAAKNSKDPRCVDPFLSDDNLGKVGKGPIFPDGIISELRGGFVDKANNRLVLGAFYNNANPDLRHGAVIAVDLTSGDRTLISATYVDGQQSDVSVGEGEALPGVADVKPSPDGKVWYALTGHAGNKGDAIFTIDPKTGKRTVFHDSTHPEVYDGTNPHCLFAKTNWLLINVLVPQSMAVAPDGSIYVPVGGPLVGNASDADLSSVGVAALSPDGSCKIISMGSQTPAFKLGTGPIAYGTYSGLVLVGSTLYAQSSHELHAIDVTTGNRTLISSPVASPKVGEGPGLQEGYLRASSDPTRLLQSGPKSAWTKGFYGYLEVDIATGDRKGHNPYGAPFPRSLNEQRWVEPHPTKPGMLLAVTGNAVLVTDPMSGASEVLSR